MYIFNINIPDKPLTNIELSTYAREIPHVRGVFMKDTLPQYPYSVECGIVNLNTSGYVIIGTGTIEFILIHMDTRPPRKFNGI